MFAALFGICLYMHLSIRKKAHVDLIDTGLITEVFSMYQLYCITGMPPNQPPPGVPPPGHHPVAPPAPHVNPAFFPQPHGAPIPTPVSEQSILVSVLA